MVERKVPKGSAGGGVDVDVVGVVVLVLAGKCHGNFDPVAVGGLRGRIVGFPPDAAAQLKRKEEKKVSQVFKDPWIPRPPSFLPITKEVGDLMMVSELIEQPGQWNKDLIHQVFSTPDSQLILSIPITLFEHDDDWLWHFTSHGHCSVKSGYNLAIGGENLQPSSSNEVMAAWWSSYWAIKIPKRILHFGWKGFHEILPSFSGLFRRQSSSHSNCPICGFGNDTNAHAIFWCSFSQVIWKEMSFSFLASPKEDLTFKGVLLYASEILEKEDFEKVLISHGQYGLKEIRKVMEVL
ncbi:hypothetical protein G4B88_017890 [Cannabis sativa]|uniref:Reverse transcriptase zinc-binding domain-containing protein n=1 Tax=Cannabis sativa TaxID=3483 RepID=A0A7J6EHR3_CANSA|nr:hypothetical protein G4B88_017890 [Cannabis sativa]